MVKKKKPMDKNSFFFKSKYFLKNKIDNKIRKIM